MLRPQFSSASSSPSWSHVSLLQRPQNLAESTAWAACSSLAVCLQWPCPCAAGAEAAKETARPGQRAAEADLQAGSAPLLSAPARAAEATLYWAHTRRPELAPCRAARQVGPLAHHAGACSPGQNVSAGRQPPSTKSLPDCHPLHMQCNADVSGNRTAKPQVASLSATSSVSCTRLNTLLSVPPFSQCFSQAGYEACHSD